MKPNRNIKYDTDPSKDIGLSSEYHLYDDLESMCVSEVTGLPDNMDYVPRIDSMWFESDFPFSDCILDVHKF